MGEEAGTPPSSSASGLALGSDLSHPSLHGLQLLPEPRGSFPKPLLLVPLGCEPSRPWAEAPTWGAPRPQPASEATAPSERGPPPAAAPAPASRPTRSGGPVRGVSVTPSSSPSRTWSQPHGTCSIETRHLQHLLSHRLKRLPLPGGAFDASPAPGSVPCPGPRDPPDTHQAPPPACR